MTPTRTPTRKHDAARKRACMRMADLACTAACLSDPALASMAEDAVAGLLDGIASAQATRGPVSELWIDGSYDAATGRAGIGVVAARPGNRVAAFGKPVRAKSSTEAEAYALAIGLSWFMDTYPEDRRLLVRYDCAAAAAASAVSLEACGRDGAPWTNLRSAVRRLRKSGSDAVFRHVKAHTGREGLNALCDLIARHYAGARLDAAQEARIAQYVSPRRRAGNGKNKKGGAAYA